MSTFDPDSFMNTSTEEKGSTSFVPVPEKDDYVATIKSAKPRAVKGDKLILDINWVIDDAEAADATGLEFPQVRQSIWLDMTEQGGLDMGSGKNITLNRLREAVGQNGAGSPWKPGDLEGAQARVMVKHRLYEDATYAEVKGVTKL